MVTYKDITNHVSGQLKSALICEAIMGRNACQEGVEHRKEMHVREVIYVRRVIYFWKMIYVREERHHRKGVYHPMGSLTYERPKVKR